jgi:hypothetical protein
LEICQSNLIYNYVSSKMTLIMQVSWFDSLSQSRLV